jgi:hypothetical protein
MKLEIGMDKITGMLVKESFTGRINDNDIVSVIGTWSDGIFNNTTKGTNVS